MSRAKLTVVISQAQGKNPAKRALEESLAAALIMESGLDVSIVPYLYDLHPDHTGRLFLESIPGDMAVLSWMYPRAAFWLLDRDNIKGHFGETRLKPPVDEDDGEAPPPKGIGALDVPERHIYCIDLRDANNHGSFVEEVLRIAAECRERRAARQPAALPAMIELGIRKASDPPLETPVFSPEQLLQTPDRRWYPVIDYSRCTNCMECIDFCLFGVYGVDTLDRIMVDNQDSCKKGCPACSRVCPEHAIIFPEFKTPAIAGAAVGAIGSLKIDLTKLFGGGDALAIAALERDRELVADGRGAVGLTVGIPKRQADKAPVVKDDLDSLMDSLDALDL
ncbi:MAG: ferredoxin family protein [Planctomycetota bacterium]|jgi:Pyruvate/2-oxoacid:ferredoxin oxidoreductase delta subunit